MKNNIKFNTILLLLFYNSLSSQSWTKVQLAPRDTDALISGVFFQDTGIIVSGVGRIINSNDYFQSFTIDTTYNNSFFEALSFPTRTTGYITTGYTPGGLLKTEDGGNDWYSPFPPGYPHVYSGVGNVLTFISPDTGYCAESAMCVVNNTTDSGDMWRDTISFIEIGDMCQQIEQIKVRHDSIIYILAANQLQTLNLFRSSDYGHSWNQISNTNLVADGDFYFVDDTMIILSGAQGILKSVDGGVTFDMVHQSSDSDGGYLGPGEHTIWFTGHDTGFLAFSLAVYKTYDAGSSWIKTDFRFDVVDSFNLITFLTGVSSQKIVVGCHDGDIYKTENGGGVAGIANIPVANSFTIYPNPANTKLYGTINYLQKNNLQIIAIDGREVIQPLAIQQTHFEIDVSNLAAGLYFLVLQNDEGKVVRRFVKE